MDEEEIVIEIEPSNWFTQPDFIYFTNQKFTNSSYAYLLYYDDLKRIRF